MLTRTWSWMYSRGHRLTHGDSFRQRSYSASRRQISAGSQPMPYSLSTNLACGNFSNTPCVMKLEMWWDAIAA